MKIRNIFIVAILLSALTACDDVFNPAIENNRGEDAMYTEPDYAQGLLGYAYAILPYETKSSWDVATDDAVTNDKSSDYIRMAQGQWSASFNPVSQWDARKCAIQYDNLFLSIVDKVEWSKIASRQQMFVDKLKGEALGLRALHYFYLLMAHGGWTADGQCLGVPILLQPEDGGSNFNQPRASFADCMKQIFADLDAAIDLLPTDFADIKSASEIPAKYQAINAEMGGYNLVFGHANKGRMSGRIAEAIRAQAALLAASPAYRDASGVTSEQAANYAAVVLQRVGGVAGLDPQGHRWYMQTTAIDDIQNGEIAEILWRGDRTNGTDDWDLGIDQERKNFPPTLYGSGRLNPSQNLVDAFPAANGYPISDTQSGYAESNPYLNRDPRLSEYIIYNGSRYRGKSIITGAYADADGKTDDGMNAISTSTRTGYYLKKLLRSDCNPDPSATNAQYHFPVRIRYTELFLTYAEAANDAWGPTGTGTNAFSAYDVIKAIRKRAGVGVTNGDAYLESVKSNQDKMTELIRNERRIELCFENKRFWDLRRWKMPLDETVTGMYITQNADGSLKYERIDVEPRVFDNSYMCHGPLPSGEVLKWSELKQNQGWR
ncbi:MAG: RagB/SusD family nutrient uptake outer membrane protein [Bacteroidaceae bacterium]|nr:RagB/SusD family nutrient uptake outer membrane protein [Bacteroidaceae bacterium]